MKDSHKIVTLKLRFNQFINYSYIIVDQVSRQAVLVDPAWEADTISKELDGLGAELAGILLTHAHDDHTHLADYFASQYTVNVYMSRKEIEDYRFNCSRLIPVEDEEIVCFGETAVKCLYTPGHTSGSASYLVEGALFPGDFLFIEGCGICSGKGASPEEMYYSIQRIKSMLPEDTRIYPGHSYGKPPGYSLEYLTKYNIYFSIENIDDFVAFRMRKNQHGLFNFK